MLELGLRGLLKQSWKGSRISRKSMHSCCLSESQWMCVLHARLSVTATVLRAVRSLATMSSSLN